MTPLFALLLTAGGDPALLPAPTQKVLDSLSKCGFPDTKPQYDPLLEEEVVLVSSSSGATDDQLACAAKASIADGTYLYFSGNTARRYSKIYYALEDAASLESSKRWLAERGLLAKVPVYRAGNDERFAIRIERFCGPTAKGFLGRGIHAHELSRTWLNRNRARNLRQSYGMVCVIHASAVAGFKIGIIGNAAVAPPKEP